mmetsp:Transcript_79239/g.222165  ORF Transcript_79239/g.222165 Transcript_79239/m.222165 type:complete len:212 (-) Transcript_79239:2-637(-)
MNQSLLRHPENPCTQARLRARGSSDGVPLEAPVVALRLLQHLPEGALPLAGLLVLLLDPQRHLHHAPRDVPIAPQRLDGLVVVARPGGLVEEGAPRVLVLAHELDLLEGVLGLPLLHLLADLADSGLGGDGHGEHPQRREHLDLGDVVLVPLGDLRGALLDEATLLIPDLPVRRGVLREDDLLALLLGHGGCWGRWGGSGAAAAICRGRAA